MPYIHKMPKYIHNVQHVFNAAYMILLSIQPSGLIRSYYEPPPPPFKYDLYEKKYDKYEPPLGPLHINV